MSARRYVLEDRNLRKEHGNFILSILRRLAWTDGAAIVDLAERFGGGLSGENIDSRVGDFGRERRGEAGKSYECSRYVLEKRSFRREHRNLPCTFWKTKDDRRRSHVYYHMVFWKKSKIFGT